MKLEEKTYHPDTLNFGSYGEIGIDCPICGNRLHDYRPIKHCPDCGTSFEWSIRVIYRVEENGKQNEED